MGNSVTGTNNDFNSGDVGAASMSNGLPVVLPLDASSPTNGMAVGSSSVTSTTTSSSPNDSSGTNRTLGHRIRQRLRLKRLRQQQQRRGRRGRPTAIDPDATNWTDQNLAIALPALVGLLADPLLSVVDTAFVGRVGAIDLAALGVCTSIFHMAFSVFRASTVATTSLVGSAPSEEERGKITKISLAFAGVVGTLVAVGLRLGGPRILTGMGVSPTSPLRNSARAYLFSRCWAAPAVVGIVVAEGAFRGHGDNRTPLVAATVAAGINLILDPLLMFPLGMGVAGAALATAISQVCAAGVYGWRLRKRGLLPSRGRRDHAAATTEINVRNVVTSILGANAAMLAKNFSMLVFYTSATAVATRMGPAHVATHQVCLSLFWLTTMWLDSGSVSAQMLMSKHVREPSKAKSLIRYMTKFALIQGLVFSAAVAAVGRFIPAVFTSDPTIVGYMSRCLPHVALQQTLVSVCLAWEGLAIGGNQFKYMAVGTATCTVGGLFQMRRATSVVDLWACTVNTFFCMRLISAVLGVARVRMGLSKHINGNGNPGHNNND
jgi:putative MATE family efflux protein